MSKDEDLGKNKALRDKLIELNKKLLGTNSNNIPFFSSTSTNSDVGKSANPNGPGVSASTFTVDEILSKKIDDYIQVSVSAAAAKVNQVFNDKLVFIQQSEKKVSQMLIKSETLMSSITLSLEKVNDLTTNSVKTQAELQEEVKYIKGNAISALSIFVSFFAFITVAINVFSKAESVVSAAVLVLIFWCLLIGFNIMISVQFKVFSNVKLIWLALGFVIFVSIFSIVGLYWFSPELRGVRYIFRFVT